MRQFCQRLMSLTAVSIVLAGPAAHGCECAELKVGDAFQAAAVIFRGTVAQIDHLNPIQPPETREDQRASLTPIPRSVDDHTLVTFHVTTGWKGPVTNIMKVFAVTRPSLCDGYRFEPKREYIVYASKELNQSWRELQPFRKGAFVYEVAVFPLRVRIDVAEEIRRLGTPLRRFPGPR